MSWVLHAAAATAATGAVAHAIALHQVLFLRLLLYVHVVRPLELHARTRLGAQRTDNGQSSKILHEDEAMRGEWQLCTDKDGDVRTVSGHRRGV